MFKTSWNDIYLENKYGVCGAKDWANAKRAELERKHGAPFNWYRAHGKYIFSVTPDFRAVQSVDAPTYEQELLSHLGKSGRSFLYLKAHIAWSWDILFAVSKSLIEKEKVSFVVNRNGKACGLSSWQKE